MKNFIKIMQYISESIAIIGLAWMIFIVLKNSGLFPGNYQEIFINKIIYIILLISVIPNYIYCLPGVINSKNIKKIETYKSYYKEINVKYLIFTHYIIILLAYIGLCIYHTNFIWLISIPIFALIFMINFYFLLCIDSVFG